MYIFLLFFKQIPMLQVGVNSYSETRIKKVMFLPDFKARTQVLCAGGVLAWYILCLVILFQLFACLAHTSMTACHVLMPVASLCHVLVRHWDFTYHTMLYCADELLTPCFREE